MKQAAAIALVCIGFALLSGGCYQRTVGAKGIGADTVAVAKPNLPAGGETVNGRRRLQYKSLD